MLFCQVTFIGIISADFCIDEDMIQDVVQA